VFDLRQGKEVESHKKTEIYIVCLDFIFTDSRCSISPRNHSTASYIYTKPRTKLHASTIQSPCRLMKVFSTSIAPEKYILPITDNNYLAKLQEAIASVFREFKMDNGPPPEKPLFTKSDIKSIVKEERNQQRQFELSFFVI
jgi:hypothetical protein